MNDSKKPFWNCFTIIVGLATVIATIFAALTYFDIKYPFSKDSFVVEDSVLVEKQENTKDTIKTREIKETVDTVKEDTSFVDLGLSVKWHKCNLGASKPEEHGDFFAWGEVEPKSQSLYDIEHYKWYKGPRVQLFKYCEKDKKTILDSSDDAAQKYGWRMPTFKEISELIDRCKWEWIVQNGVNGYLVTGPSGNSIFLPTTGRQYKEKLLYKGKEGSYWSKECILSGPGDEPYAKALLFDKTYVNPYTTVLPKHIGLSIRPVTP